MTLETKIAQLDRNIAECQRVIDISKTLERLESNRDFKKIIKEMYLTNEAVRLVHAKAEPALQSPDKQAKIIRDMDAIGSLASFMANIHIEARMAAKTLHDDEETREELVAGDLND